MGTSWISRKGEILQKGVWPRKKGGGGGWPPLPTMQRLSIIKIPVVPGSKPLGGSLVDSAFHPSKVHQMSTGTPGVI